MFINHISDYNNILQCYCLHTREGFWYRVEVSGEIWGDHRERPCTCHRIAMRPWATAMRTSAIHSDPSSSVVVKCNGKWEWKAGAFRFIRGRSTWKYKTIVNLKICQEQIYGMWYCNASRMHTTEKKSHIIPSYSFKINPCRVSLEQPSVRVFFAHPW